jgi:excisionase family DNA binding protein
MTRYSPAEITVEQIAYTVQQAARMIGRSERKIKDLIATGRLTAFQDGPRKIMITRAELERWVNSLPVVAPSKKLSQDVK